MCVLFFEEKESQIEFGNNLKININNINFEDKYEIGEEIGEGHFAVSFKRIEKARGLSDRAPVAQTVLDAPALASRLRNSLCGIPAATHRPPAGADL